MANIRKQHGRPRKYVRDSRLPKTFPGCWQDPSFRRKYNQIDMQIRRAGEYQCVKAEDQAAVTEWGREELRRQAAIRDLVRRVVPHACFNCNQRAEKYAIRRVKVIGGQREVWAMLRWCGKC